MAGSMGIVPPHRTYAKFAPFYDALLRSERRDKRQAGVLEWLFGRYGLPRDAELADVACGCGGTVAELLDAGFCRTRGCDASAEMLRFARARCPLATFTECLWSDLPSAFAASQGLSAVWALGQSVAHCADDEFGGIFRAFQRVLRPGGLCVVDVRDWVATAAHPAFEYGRPVGAYRWLGRLRIDGTAYDVEDWCDYADTRQITSYRVTPTAHGPSEAREFQFSWSTRSGQELCGDMRAAGFARAEVVQHPDWPYLLVIGVNI